MSVSIRGARVAALSTVLLGAFAAQAQSALYAVDGASGTSSTLYRLDAGDGSVLQTIGPVGFNGVTGIAFDPVTDVLYGVTSASHGPGELLTIDLATGAGTLVGTHGLRSPDLAFAPSGLLYTWDQITSDLHLLDLSTAAPTTVGNCGAAPLAPGLAIDASGTAYVKDARFLYSVDRVTGLCGPPLAFSPNLTYQNLLAFDDAGTLYTAQRVGGTSTLYTVDVQTGATTEVGSNSIASLSSLAFQPAPQAALYATDGATSSGSPSTLYLLDPSDGSLLQTIGPVGFDAVTGLDFHPVTGELYGQQSAAAGGHPGQLLTIDLGTGAGSAVGASNGATVGDMAFAPSGLLFAWLVRDASNTPVADLGEIDLATGQANVVGDCGFPSTMGPGLAIDARGDAFLVSGASALSAVDRDTGACTVLESLGAPLTNVLTISPRGTAYSLNRTGGGADIYTLDLQTGDTRLVGSNPVVGLAALAFQHPPLPPLYAVDGAGGLPSTLYRLDPRDGSVLETVGPVGFDGVEGLAFHPRTGVLYATENVGEALLTIDVQTGGGTLVGTHAEQIQDLAFAPAGQLYGWQPDVNELLTLDLSTAVATVFVSFCSLSSQTGLAIDAFGTAYINAFPGPFPFIFEVNRVTGACSTAAIGGVWDNALAFSPRGTLYAVDRTGGGADLYSIDTETGDQRLIGSNALASLSAIAFEPPVVFLPEPSLPLQASAAVAALAMLARRRRTTRRRSS